MQDIEKTVFEMKLEYCQELLKICWGIRVAGILVIESVDSEFMEINAVVDYVAYGLYVVVPPDEIDEMTKFCNRLSEIMAEYQIELPEWEKEMMVAALPFFVAGEKPEALLKHLKGFFCEQEGIMLENWYHGEEIKILQIKQKYEGQDILQELGLRIRAWDFKKNCLLPERPAVIKKILQIYPDYYPCKVG